MTLIDSLAANKFISSVCLCSMTLLSGVALTGCATLADRDQRLLREDLEKISIDEDGWESDWKSSKAKSIKSKGKSSVEPSSRVIRLDGAVHFAPEPPSVDHGSSAPTPSSESLGSAMLPGIPIPGLPSISPPSPTTP